MLPVIAGLPLKVKVPPAGFALTKAKRFITPPFSQRGVAGGVTVNTGDETTLISKVVLATHVPEVYDTFIVCKPVSDEGSNVPVPLLTPVPVKVNVPPTGDALTNVDKSIGADAWQTVGSTAGTVITASSIISIEKVTFAGQAPPTVALIVYTPKA